MSHYTVMVRLPEAVPHKDIESSIAKMLEPYKEGNEEFQEFNDQTANVTKEYETGTTDRVFLKGDPTPHSPYDDRFRGSGVFGMGSGYQYPDGYEMRQVPFNQIYSSLQEFTKEWHGYEVQDDGRIGYMSDTQGHWDWYQIGGRWRGKIPYRGDHHLVQPVTTVEERYGGRSYQPETKARHCDGVRLCHIDQEEVTRQTAKCVDERYTEYMQYIEGKRDWPHFEGPRMWMINCGLMDCLGLNEPRVEELRAGGWRVEVWDEKTAGRRAGERCDVLAPPITREQFAERFSFKWSPLHTYAYVDKDGWVQPGRMGWFGVAHTEPEGVASFDDRMAEWLKSGDQNDWIIVVDCHT